MKHKIEAAQLYLQEMKIDGWLLYDFHRMNDLAHLFLEIPASTKVTRRFFYWIPAKGEPVRIVHAIETHTLDAWPGEKRTFLSWESLEQEVRRALQGARKVAMEYSRNNAIPYVSKVDAGTVDLIRSVGVEVVSSGSFLPHFTAVLTKRQGESHQRAGKALSEIAEQTWQWIGHELRQGKTTNEFEVQQRIAQALQSKGLVTDDPPIVAVNAHSADPHFSPSRDHPAPIRRGDFVLIDLWGKQPEEGAVFGDITRVAVADGAPTKRQQEIFSYVRRAQKEAVRLVRERFEQNKPVFGWEVDDAARNIIRHAGYGDYFIHRTGHSIEVHLHGSGTHMDNLEMHDERPILKGTCFSIEPGIYLPGEFGVRLEHDVYVHLDGSVEIVGGEQDEIVCLISTAS